MIKDITIGQYFPGDSVLHRADPRMKIILAFVYMALVFFINTFWGYLSVALFTVMLIVISGIPVRHTLKGLKPLILIISFAAILNVLSNQKGTVLFEYDFIHVTTGGLIEAARISLRIILLVVAMSFLTLTTTPILLTDAIEKLLSPFKKVGLPAHEIAMMMTIALRFIPTLIEETDKIMKAQAARGADFDTGNFVQRAKSFIPVLVPLFISAFRRADDLANAMEARCYRGSEGRTRMKALKLQRIDLWMTLLMMVFTTGVILLQIL